MFKWTENNFFKWIQVIRKVNQNKFYLLPDLSGMK